MQGSPFVVSFHSAKAGIGKTMAVLNTGYALAMSGRNVLLVDLDLERPGLSEFLTRNEECYLSPEGDILNLLIWAKQQQPGDATNGPGLDQFVSAPRENKLAACTPEAGELGRIDFILADVGRNYTERQRVLGLPSMSGPRRQHLATTLREYLKRQSFYYGPDYYGDYTCPYDYVLVDCPAGPLISNACFIDPLADRTVVCTDLNADDAAVMAHALATIGMGRQPEGAYEPWDEADVRDGDPAVPTRLGPRPAIVVATPVPASDLETKRRCLRRLEEGLGKVATTLTYHPYMAFNSSVFVRDCQEEYLARDYRNLAEAVTALFGDHATQLLPQAIEAWFVHNDASRAAELALRIAPQNAALGKTILAILKDTISPASDAEFRLAEQIYRTLAETTLDPIDALYAWAHCLESWVAYANTAEVAALRRQAALATFNRLLSVPDLDPVIRAECHFHGAILNIAEDEPEGALASFTAVVQDPAAPAARKADALFNRGLIRDELGDPDGAIDDFSILVEMADAPAERRAEALFNRGLVRDDNDDFHGAIGDWTDILELEGATAAQCAQALFNRGASYKDAGDHNQALEDWSRVIAMEDAPDNLRAKTHLTRGALSLSLGELDAAGNDFDVVIAMRGLDPAILADAFFNRGLIRERLEDPEGATKDWRAVARLPKAPPNLIADASVRLGIDRQAAGDTRGAITEFSRAIDAPDVDPYYLADAYYNRGVAYQEAHDFAAALADWTRIVDMEAAPEEILARALLSRGIVYSETEAVEDAVTDLTRVTEMKQVALSVKAEAFLNRGTVNADRGQTDEALADLNTVLDFEEATEELKLRARLAKAVALRNAGNYEDAVAQLDQILELDDCPEDIRHKTYNTRAVVHERRGDLDKAIADFECVADDDEAAPPRRAFACSAIARIFVGKEQFDKAIAAANAALEIDPALAHTRANLALATLASGDAEGATKLYAQLIDSLEQREDIENYVVSPLKKALQKGWKLGNTDAIFEYVVEQRKKLKKN